MFLRGRRKNVSLVEEARKLTLQHVKGEACNIWHPFFRKYSRPCVTPCFLLGGVRNMFIIGAGNVSSGSKKLFPDPSRGDGGGVSGDLGRRYAWAVHLPPPPPLPRNLQRGQQRDEQTRWTPGLVSGTLEQQRMRGEWRAQSRTRGRHVTQN